MIGFIEWGVTGSAGVDAGRGHVLVVFAGEGGFGAFLADDTELLFAVLACCACYMVERAYLLIEPLAIHRQTFGVGKTSCLSCWYQRNLIGRGSLALTCR